MREVCSKCGLPKALCVCGVLEKEKKIIKIFVERRKFGKLATIIEGIEEKEAKKIVSKLKQSLGCGGTFKEGHIELQGEHRTKAKVLLVKFGYPEDMLEVS